MLTLGIHGHYKNKNESQSRPVINVKLNGHSSKLKPTPRKDLNPLLLIRIKDDGSYAEHFRLPLTVKSNQWNSSGPRPPCLAHSLSTPEEDKIYDGI